MLPDPYPHFAPTVLALFSYTVQPKVHVRELFDHKIGLIFLSIGLNMCFGSTKEPIICNPGMAHYITHGRIQGWGMQTPHPPGKSQSQ